MKEAKQKIEDLGKVASELVESIKEDVQVKPAAIKDEIVKTNESAVGAV